MKGAESAPNGTVWADTELGQTCVHQSVENGKKSLDKWAQKDTQAETDRQTQAEWPLSEAWRPEDFLFKHWDYLCFHKEAS